METANPLQEPSTELMNAPPSSVCAHSFTQRSASPVRLPHVVLTLSWPPSKVESSTAHKIALFCHVKVSVTQKLNKTPSENGSIHPRNTFSCTTLMINFSDKYSYDRVVSLDETNNFVIGHFVWNVYHQKLCRKMCLKKNRGVYTFVCLGGFKILQFSKQVWRSLFISWR